MVTSSSISKSYGRITVIMLLLFLGLAFRASNINREFSGDEGLLVRIAGEPSGEVIRALKSTDAYPPLTYIFVHHMMKISRSAAWIRSYFILFGIGVSILIYLIAKEYFDVKVAMIALALSVFSPLLIFLSQYARSYIDSAFWMLSATLFFIKIVRGGRSPLNWAGYIISAALSLYTFYFSILMLFAHFIFVTIFFGRNTRYLLGWYTAFGVSGLAFAAWAPSALAQFHNASSLVFDWASKGFNVGALKIGLYMRNLFAVIGFDPFFMVFPEGTANKFFRPALILAALLSAGLLLVFIRIAFRSLRERFGADKKLVWLIPILITVPLVTAWTMASAVNMMTTAKYLAAFHSLFLILLAFIIYKTIEKNRIKGTVLLAVLLAIFAVRIPQAVSSEFDDKAVLNFLTNNVRLNEGFVCIRLPSERWGVNVINISPAIKLNEKGSDYILASKGVWEGCKDRARIFKKVWEYRVYGNDELFGANRLMDELLAEAGFKRTHINKFKNIDIVEYESR